MGRRTNTVDEARLDQLIAQGLRNSVIALRMGVTPGAIYFARCRLQAKKNKQEKTP